MAEVHEIWDAELGYGPLSFLKRDVLRERPIGAEPLWGVAKVEPTGDRMLHVFPHSVLEWRAAEYAIDPDDIDTLLEVVLYEPYMPREDDPLAMTDQLMAAVLDDVRGLPTCWTPGVPDADRRAAHLERVAAVRRHLVELVDAPRPQRQAALEYVGSDRVAPVQPLDPIRAQTRLDPVRVASRRMAVEWERSAGDRNRRPSYSAKPMNTIMGMQPPRPTRVGGAR
ncbi:hypothetical protein AB0J43_01455 [Nonomuraea fuscirosea]